MTEADAAKVILIVEDNDKNLKLVRDLLQFHGYRTLEATTAEAGIAVAAERLPDLILMDIRLPGMDGMTALGLLRADPATAAIPVVAVTASVMPEDRDRFVRAGFDGFIEKPIDIKAFPAEVAAMLDRARARR